MSVSFEAIQEQYVTFEAADSAASSPFSRDRCVMRREALIAKRNDAGVTSTQFSSIGTAGMR